MESIRSGLSAGSLVPGLQICKRNLANSRLDYLQKT